MSRKLIQMEQIKQILQLRNDNIPVREIARRTGLSRNCVKKYLRRLNIQYPVNADVTAQQLAIAAYNGDGILKDASRREDLEKHFQYAEKELSKTGMTRFRLWSEYKELHPQGYNYSQYCYHFTKYLKDTDVVMHLEYTPGDMIMVDFAGKKLSYVDKDTEEVIECEVFIAVFPFSGMTFCKAVASQKTNDFIVAVNEMLKYFGAVPMTILCDNLRTAVTRTCKIEPGFTDMCYQISEHYQTTFSATRPYTPRDKAMVERYVRIVYTEIYASLRNARYHNLEDLNIDVRELLDDLNNKIPYRRGQESRRLCYQQYELPSLRELGCEPYTIKNVHQCTVQRNYHIQLRDDKLYYSVPYTYVGKKVKVLYDSRVVEVYYDHERIAVHIRCQAVKGWHTIHQHMPPNHQKMKEIKGWNKDDLLSQAVRVGPYTQSAVQHMLSNSIYMEQNYKACFGMLMLAKRYTSQRLESACKRVAGGSRINYTMIKNILAHGLDKSPMLFDQTPLPHHDNIRGPQNYR